MVKTSGAYGTSGSTSSTMRSAHSMARRLPQLGHSPRALHEKGSSRSCPQSPQCKRIAKVEIAAAEEPLIEIDDPRVEGPVLVAKAKVVDALELLEVRLDDVLECVARRARNVAPLAEGDSHGSPRCPSPPTLTSVFLAVK